MALSEWFRDHRWDHYQAHGEHNVCYSTTAWFDDGTETWSVSVTRPCMYRIGEASTLAEVQLLAEKFESQSIWVKKWLLSENRKRFFQLLRSIGSN